MLVSAYQYRYTDQSLLYKLFDNTNITTFTTKKKRFEIETRAVLKQGKIR